MTETYVKKHKSAFACGRIGSYFAEYVMEGHPDKLCDLIADAIVDEYLMNDPHARVACEVLVGKNLVVVAGEITSHFAADIEAVVRRTLIDVGYVGLEMGISADQCRVMLSLSEQSTSLRKVLTPPSPHLPIPASDQAVVVGYAVRNDFGMIPAESYFAKRIAVELANRRLAKSIPDLWPDGKTLVTIGASCGS